MIKLNLIKEKVLLSENARLFDTKEYLVKTFVAVLIAAYIGANVSYISKDMISLLFGMILTLEPANMSGIRSGLTQLQATIIGAVITGIVVAILGYGIIQTAIAITLTLYICLVIDWRHLMVVALFTSIYMTQYVQLDTFGNSSEIETFKLRIVALGSGVLIAFGVNFLFSIFGYKRMVNKRIFYITKEIYEHMSSIKVALLKNDIELINEEMIQLPTLFNTIDWIAATLGDVKSDQERFKVVYRHFEVDEFLAYVKGLRGVTHLIYDLCMRVQTSPELYMEEEFITDYVERIEYFELVKNAFNQHSDIPSGRWAKKGDCWMDRFSDSLGSLKI